METTPQRAGKRKSDDAVRRRTAAFTSTTAPPWRRIAERGNLLDITVPVASTAIDAAARRLSRCGWSRTGPSWRPVSPGPPSKKVTQLAVANSIRSINVASSSLARELFTLLETGHRTSKSFGAGVSNSIPEDLSSHPSKPAGSRITGIRS